MIADEMITEPAAAPATAPAAAPASDGAASEAAPKKPSARRAKKPMKRLPNLLNLPPKLPRSVAAVLARPIPRPLLPQPRLR